MHLRSFVVLLIAAMVLTALMAACAPTVQSNALLVEAESKTRTASSLAPGEYITSGGWGHLQFSQRDNILTFSIESVTGEDYCALDGTILGDLGTADGENGQPECIVSFTNISQGIEISSKTPAECRSFCGLNGSFEGTYMSIKDGCGRSDIERTRALFKGYYESNNYETAQATLSPALTDCLATLEWEEEGHIRNDLAITQYKNGLATECLITVEKYAEDARKDDDEVVDGWSPVLADRYLEIVRAARANIDLCSEAASGNLRGREP